MKHPIDRREFLKLAGLGGVVFASSLGAARAAGTMAAAKGGASDDFYFVQLSDSHWGFEGPPNPDAKGTLKKAVAAVNSLSEQPDFIVFTGDLTHTTDDPKVRRQRLTQFKDIVSELKVKDVRFMPGEHDASLDHGEAYQEFFGKTYYTFDHKGVHFIALDNVSDPRALIGEEQLQWLAADVKKQPQDANIVVLTHRPLFDLYPQWDWATRDGAQAIEFRELHRSQERNQFSEVVHAATYSKPHRSRALRLPLGPLGFLLQGGGDGDAISGDGLAQDRERLVAVQLEHELQRLAGGRGKIERRAAQRAAVGVVHLRPGRSAAE